MKNLLESLDTEDEGRVFVPSVGKHEHNGAVSQICVFCV